MDRKPSQTMSVYAGLGVRRKDQSPEPRFSGERRAESGWAAVMSEFGADLTLRQT